jgi:hypothetical protein
MKTINHKTPYGDYQLNLSFGKYNNGQTAIKLTDSTDGMPFATATVCVEDHLLKEGEVAIKDYSENAGILNSLIDADIVEHPHAFVQSGWVKIPICKLKIVNNF